MKYNFDEIIDNQNVDNMRYRILSDPKVLPMTVADMEFRVAPVIQEAIERVNQHGVFGYTLPPKALVDLLVERLAQRHHWSVRPEWIVFTPGLVPAITTACHQLAPHEEVLTCTPVYHPFLLSPTWANRNLKTVPMIWQEGRLTFDFEAIEQAIGPQTKLFLLSNPHNPGGTVFRKNELQQLVQICHRHGVTLCSDEIHCDLVLEPGLQHTSTATISPEASDCTITMLAPSKTFNTAGLGLGFVVIPNDTLREKFKQSAAGMYPQLSRFAYEGALAAYRDAEPWRLALVDYLKDNHDFLEQEINQIKGLRFTHLEATYLAWIDTRETGIEDFKGFCAELGIGITDGKVFGQEGFVRMNFAFPRKTLESVVEKLRKALS
jgi:cysteine-S-conjugate beta-lyase